MSLFLLHFLVMTIFILGYAAIIFEFHLKVNKTAVGIFIAVVCWMLYFLGSSHPVALNIQLLSGHLSDISQIIFFLLGAMTLVELIDSHKGFHTVARLICTRSKKKVLWIVSFLSFFLSAILDNLTTTILMISILRKVVPQKQERTLLCCMVVIAANAGGAWTPIGDVTTTMLWINGQVSTLSVIQEVFFPSLISMLIPLFIYTYILRGEYPVSEVNFQDEKKEPGSRIVFILGIAALVFVPIFKWLTGMPPFMGILIGLSSLWLVTDVLHHKHEHRQHLRVPYILTKIDVSSILFFLGILLSVNALEAVGLLEMMAHWFDQNIQSTSLIATAMGLVSAIVDNVPLVAAAMGMYDLATYPIDSSLWLLIAYTAGTGGSILVIGSSAGVALMGIEKIDFFTYLKKASLPALIGYLGGVIAYLLFSR